MPPSRGEQPMVVLPPCFIASGLYLPTSSRLNQAGGGGAYADAAVYLDATGILARHCGMHIYTYICRDLNPARR